jgi:CRP/FNR family transcriptional regulator, cyclic AMP receptor protein
LIAQDHLRRIAAWSRELKEPEIEVARAGIVEKSFAANEYILMRGDHFDYWAGVVTGLVRMGIVSRRGKATSFTGLTAGAWFGEGSVLKNEARRYDIVALRDSRIAMMDRATFLWLFENSVGFNRFLVGQLNERLGQFIGLVEHGRTLDAARLARGIASLFNANLFPETARHLEITQEEIGALAGIWRRNANRYLKTLEQQGLLRLEYGAATIIELERLRYYGDWKSRNVGGLIAQFQIDLGTTEYALDNSRLIRLRIRSDG